MVQECLMKIRHASFPNIKWIVEKEDEEFESEDLKDFCISNIVTLSYISEKSDLSNV